MVSGLMPMALALIINGGPYESQQLLIVVAVVVSLAAVPNDQHRNVFGKFGFLRMVVKTITFYVVQHCAMWLWIAVREVCINTMNEAHRHIEGSDINHLIKIVDVHKHVIHTLVCSAKFCDMIVVMTKFTPFQMSRAATSINSHEHAQFVQSLEESASRKERNNGRFHFKDEHSLFHRKLDDCRKTRTSLATMRGFAEFIASKIMQILH